MPGKSHRVVILGFHQWTFYTFCYMFKYITIFIFFQPEPSGAASSNGSSPGMFYVSDDYLFSHCAGIALSALHHVML